MGPHELPFAAGRSVYFAVPPVRSPGARLIANLHGVCNPPAYACGYWFGAAVEKGFLVCPTGDGRCGAASFNAPTWVGGYDRMDADLEAAIGAVDAAYPAELSREGAVLTGFSKGAYAAARIAVKHPGRWPHLILIEADVALDAAALRAAGVTSVALLAGERGSQLAGERRTTEALVKKGFPARLWVMRKAGHHYSDDIEALMREALVFVLDPQVAAGPP